MNKINLIGRLTKENEIRYTQSGDAVLANSIAVKRNYKDKNGEVPTDFINFKLWRKAAENFSTFTSKGALVGLSGSLETRNYEDKNGNMQYFTEVNVDSFDLIESRAATEERKQQQQQTQLNEPTVANSQHDNSVPVDKMAQDYDELPF